MDADMNKLCDVLASLAVKDPKKWEQLQCQVQKKKTEMSAVQYRVNTDPVINSLDIRDLLECDSEWISLHDSKNPFTETIFMVDFNTEFSDIAISHRQFCKDIEEMTFSENNWVAGSAVLKLLVRHLPSVDRQIKKAFINENTDVDIFKLSQGKVKMTKIVAPRGNRIDYIDVPAKSVEELLMGFDLPCCRAALMRGSGCNFKLCVSFQCLKSLMTTEVTLPAYMRDVKPYLMESQNLRSIFTRFCIRVSKYEKRGFEFQYAQTEDQWPWFSQGFMYEDSNVQEMKIKRVGDQFTLDKTH